MHRRSDGSRFLLSVSLYRSSFFFFFNDTATTEIYTLSLHDALPISSPPTPTAPRATARAFARPPGSTCHPTPCAGSGSRSEEHTSELQSRLHLVCRLLLEKQNSSQCSRQSIIIASALITLAISSLTF